MRDNELGPLLVLLKSLESGFVTRERIRDTSDDTS